MLTAMGAATILKSQNPEGKVAVKDLQTGRLIVVPLEPATQQRRQ
jgi:hypothetical protein